MPPQHKHYHQRCINTITTTIITTITTTTITTGLNPECATAYILLAEEEQALDIAEAETKFREAFRCTSSSITTTTIINISTTNTATTTSITTTT